MSKLFWLVAIFLIVKSNGLDISPALAFLLRLSTVPSCANNLIGNVCVNSTDTCSRRFAACFGNGIGYESDCPSATPYCVLQDGQGVCTSNVPENCLVAGDSSYQCTDEGVFPDPTNCDRFMNCVRQRDNSLSAVPGTCPTNYVFTPNVPVVFCKRRVRPAECTTLSCRNAQNPTFLAYGTLYRQYFAFCQNSTSTPTVLKCFTNHIADVTVTPPRCTFVCPREGIYASPNQSSFYFCYIGTNGRLTFRVQACPEGFIFDTATSTCILMPTSAPTIGTTSGTTIAGTTNAPASEAATSEAPTSEAPTSEASTDNPSTEETMTSV